MRSPAILCIVLLALLVPMAGCLSAGASGPQPAPDASAWSQDGTGPRLLQTLGDPRTSGASKWPGPFDNTPAWFDIDGDGDHEVIAQSLDRKVYVFDSTTGRILATLPTTYPPSWHVERILNGVQAGMLVPGQPSSIVVANSAANVAVWTFDPERSSTGRFVFDKAWEKRMDGCHKNAGMDAAPSLVDLDGDRSLEILVQTEEVGLFALTTTGTELWRQCWGGGNSAPTAADLDGDGKTEAIFGSDAGLVSVFRGVDGRPLWTYDASQLGLDPASIAVTPTIAELDGRAPKEIVFTARQAPDDERDFTANHMAIVAVHQDPATYQGTLLWARQPAWANPLSYTRLVILDVDADGSSDIFGMDWNTIGHSPGDWERLGPAHVFRLDASGNDVWVRPMDSWWSNQDIVLLEGRDGRYEVIVNGPADPGDGLWRLSADTGKPLGSMSLSPWKMLRGPLVVDAAPGTTRMIMPVGPVEAEESRGAILVFELAPGPSRPSVTSST